MHNSTKDSLRFTFAYVLFCILFISSALTLSVLAGNDIVLIENNPEAGVSGEAPIVEENNKTFLLMIDAGHGGEDGGAVSDGGVYEKDLNLAVSENIADLSMLFGQPYSMTRDSDKLLYDKYSELTDYTGKKKSLDLKNRLRSADEENADVFLSIHMNKFTSPASMGLQVYYSPNNEGSRVLAEAITAYNKAHLQKDNERETKAATSSIYLLHRLQIPAVLVECGFLSNPDETARLQTETYRASLACTVFTPVLEYCTRDSAKQ